MRRKQIKSDIDNNLNSMFDKNEHRNKYSNVLTFKSKKNYFTFTKKNFTLLAITSVFFSFCIGGIAHKLINRNASFFKNLESITLEQLESDARIYLSSKNYSSFTLSKNNFIRDNLVVNFYLAISSTSSINYYYFQIAELNYRQFNINLNFNINNMQTIELANICNNKLDCFVENIDIHSMSVDMYSNDVFLKNINVI